MGSDNLSTMFDHSDRGSMINWSYSKSCLTELQRKHWVLWWVHWLTSRGFEYETHNDCKLKNHSARGSLYGEWTFSPDAFCHRKARLFLKTFSAFEPYQINAKIEIVIEVVGDVIGLLTKMNFHLIFRLVVCSVGTANFGEYILTKIAKFNDFGKVFFFSLIVNLLQF